MIVVMDTALSENVTFMDSLIGHLDSLEVDFRVSSDAPPGSVTWLRKSWERSVDESAEVRVGCGLCSLVPSLPCHMERDWTSGLNCLFDHRSLLLYK